MAKIKLTEAQIEMLKRFESTPKKKILKITEDQMERIFKPITEDVFNTPIGVKPSTKVTKNFKKSMKDIPDGDEVNVEGSLIGHPIAGSGGDEYNPQSEKENQVTYKAFNEAQERENKTKEKFKKEIKKFMKDLIQDPKAKLSKFFIDHDITKEKLYKEMKKLGIIGHGIVNDKRVIKIYRDGIEDNMKKLYANLFGTTEMTQFGDDIEMSENGSDRIKDMMSEPFKKKEGPKKSPEEIKRKLSTLRAKELERRKNKNDRPIGEDGSERIGQYSNRVGGAGMIPKHKYSTGDKVLVDMGDGTKEKLTINREKYFKAPKGKFHLTYSMMEYGDNMIFSEDMILKLLSKRSDTTELEEDNYPLGAKNDPNAPWNQKDLTSGRRPKETPFDIVLWHEETAIFKKDGKFYAFCVECVESSEYAEYADREEIYHGHDEDGMPYVEYGDWELDEWIIEAYVNDNYKHLSYGKGLDAWEDGVEMVELDQEMVDEFKTLTKYIREPKAKQKWGEFFSNLSIDETTTAASSGAFVGKMGMNSPIGKIGGLNRSPENEMGDVIEDSNSIEGDIESKINTIKFSHPKFGDFGVVGIHDISDEDPNLYRVIIKLVKLQDGSQSRVTDSHLLFYQNLETGEEKLFFNHEYEALYDVFKLFDEVYHQDFQKIMDAIKSGGELEETTKAASSGAYVTPKVWAKDKDNMRFAKKTIYPKGKVVDPTLEQAGDSHKKTAYPQGGFVELDDCTKLKNNKEAQKGGCSQGAADNVVKTRQTKDSLISDDALYYE